MAHRPIDVWVLGQTPSKALLVPSVVIHGDGTTRSGGLSRHLLDELARRDQRPLPGGRTATLSHRAPVARRTAKVSVNGDVRRACNAPVAS